MDFFESGGVPIAYQMMGEGAPIVLVHGFASTHAVNWIETGWAAALSEAGYRVIMLDMRGHGESGKPYDPDAYAVEAMAGDVTGLMDHLSIPRAALMGYSMGARIALYLAATVGARFSPVIAAGVGGTLFGPRVDPGPVLAGLAAADPASVRGTVARAFRRFADANHQDLRALHACYGRARAPLSAAVLARIEVPVLVVAGETDTIAGDPAALAAAIPGAVSVLVPRRDHMRTVGDKFYKQAVLDFLETAMAG